MYSSEVFSVVKVRVTSPTTYIVQDRGGHSIETPLYRHNLIRAEPGYEKHRRVSRIVSRRAVNTDRPEFLVEFEDNTAPREWISKSQLDAYKQPFT